uniref:Uncharacterized LOC114456599 n=2 Tax=Gouania willdenowi TaxID=441366 RepID=A0A8C5I9Q6_GOUWI
MINLENYYAWIGLTKDSDTEIWMWRSTSIPIYTWAKGEPQPTDSCASIFYSTKELYGFPCEVYFFFVCRKYIQFVFVDESKTLKGAEEYCQKHDMTLATLLSSDDLKKFVNYEFSFWIQTVNGSEPNQSDKCTTMTTKAKTVAARTCSDHFPSVCMTDNVILIMEKKTWEEAMTHCRELVLSPEDQSRYELVSVEAGIDDAFLRARASQADTEQVWVGLRFLGRTWFWINRISMSYPDLPQCPPPGKNCGVISKTSAHLEMADCGEKKNFLCYKL